MTRVPCPACEHTNVDANFCDRCVIVVLLQPGARASLDRARSQPMGPMPEWIEDLGHLAAAALWVGPLNLLWSLLSG